MENAMNKWESVGLGKAPFRCVGMFKMPNKETATMSDYAALPKGYGAGSCAVCGTGLVYNYMIHSADGRKFVVGCDCVFKTGDTVTVNAVRKMRSEAKAKARDEKNAAMARARLDAQRAKNGGLTDAEMRKKERDEKIAADRAALEACHGDVFATVRESGDEFGCAVLASVLGRGYASEKQLNCIYGVADRYIAAKNAKNEYFGEVGKRIKVVLTVKKWIQLRPATYTFSALWLCIAQDAEGRTFKYMGGSSSCLPMSGETREVTFTVKEHDEYNGTKQTVMARPAYKD